MGPRGNLRAALALAALGLFGIQWLNGPLGDPSEGPRTWTDDRETPSLRGEPRLPDGDLRRALRAQAGIEGRLFRLPGVHTTGVGIGPTGRPVIAVYVEPGTTTRAQGRSLLPESVDGVPIDVRVAMPFYALSPPAGSPAALPARADAAPAAVASDPVNRRSRFERPVPIGVSAGHRTVTAGTIGALVTDGTDLYALSNYHVFVGGPEAKVGDPTLQPGIADGGIEPDDAIGTLADFEPIRFSMFARNRIDAALSRTDNVGHRTPSDGYGAPRGAPMDAVPGLEVKKYGRTTGLTQGAVEAINATISVRYRERGAARFTGQVIICCSMSQGGDSGSLIVADDVDREGQSGADDRRPVALLFAGNGALTIANPIGEVLDRFGVTIVGDPGN